MTAVQPAATTRWPKTASSGVIPGASLITMTAGPLPARNTSRRLPSASKLSLVYRESAASHLPTWPLDMAGP